MCRNKSFLSFVPTPCEASAALYWHIKANTKPNTPSKIMTPPILRTYDLSPFAIPLSIILAITSGTISSKMASNNLKNGPIITCFLKLFK